MINANRIMKKLSKTKEDKQEVVSELVQETIETVAEIESTPEITNPISDTLESMNYEKFSYVAGNRVIYPTHVKRLKKSINKIGYIKSNPIVVDKDFNIIDGQHRFEACKALHIPVVYKIEERMSKHVILSLNESQQQWNVKDYIHLHATNGIRFYERAEEFEKEHKLGPSNTITILSGLIGYNVNDIREGKNFPIYSRIEEVLDFLFFAKEYISFWKNSKFVRSIVYIHNELSPKDILKLKNKVALFMLQNSQKDFLQMYENLLNKGRQNKIILVNNK